MSRIDEFDALKNENWSQLYAEVPPCVNEGVQLAFARIRARERRRRATVRTLALAACLVLVFGAAGMMLRRDPDTTDRVAAPQVELRSLNYDSNVYAAQADPYFHVHSRCSAAMAEQVKLQLVTALEFQKEICPSCGGNVQLP